MHKSKKLKKLRVNLHVHLFFKDATKKTYFKKSEISYTV